MTDQFHVEPLRASDIVYRDEVLLAIHKPARLSTLSSDGADDLVGRVKRMLALERGTPIDKVYVGALDHLERDASGLVLLTLDKRANRGLAQQLEQAKIERAFDVVTARDHAPRRVEKTTQRSVQLRAELAQRGTPVVGDVRNAGPPAHRAMCHARSLRLRHPITDAPLVLSCDAPATLRTLEQDAITQPTSPLLMAALLREALSERCCIAWHEEPTNTCRLVNAEGDGLPGLAIDRYDDWLVMHVFDERWLEHASTIARELHTQTRCRGLYLKQHPKQKNELDEQEIAALADELPFTGEPAPQPLRVTEHGVPLYVRLGDGLRTGLFLDQRDNRRRVGDAAAKKRVLNLFAYTCGFSVTALAGDAAHVTSVDASALVMSRVEPSLRDLAASDRHRALVGDCFDVLRRLRETRERFDIVIVDPPSYASTSAGRFKLRRDYAALIEASAHVLSPHGVLLACTNHHTTHERDLRAFVQEGLQRAGRRTAQLRSLPAGLDFPLIAGAAAELKSVWVEVV